MENNSLYGVRIWTEDWKKEDELCPRICYFRKCVWEKEINPEGILRIAADSRYKLFINGIFIQEGPCKANRGNFYYDTCRIGNYLHSGKNCIAIEVLRYPEDFSRRNHSLLRTGLPYLYLGSEGEGMDVLVKPEGWRSRTARNRCFRGEDTVPAPLHIIEDTVGEEAFHGWKEEFFEDKDWAETEQYEFNRMKLSDTPRTLKERPIPYAKLSLARLWGEWVQTFFCHQAHGAYHLTAIWKRMFMAGNGTGLIHSFPKSMGWRLWGSAAWDF